MKINALTGTRGIAAIMVVIHHFAADMYPFTLLGNLRACGNLAVGYFFVLSGFVLFISQNKLNVLSFIRNRFMRLAPAYYAALAMTLLIIGLPLTGGAYLPVLYQALFAHAFIPDYVLELNSPSWSVSVEMFFYLLFPLLFVLKKHSKWLIGLTAVAYTVSQVIHLSYCNTANILGGSAIYFSPLIHLNQFMLGMAGGYLFSNYRQYFRRKYMTPLLAAVMIALILIRPDHISYQAGLISPVFMALIVSIAANDVKWLSGSIPVFLGEISYGIYIYQYPVFKFLTRLNDRYLHYQWNVAFYVCLAILMLVATASYYLCERPVLKLARRKVTEVQTGIRNHIPQS